MKKQQKVITSIGLTIKFNSSSCELLFLSFNLFSLLYNFLKKKKNLSFFLAGRKAEHVFREKRTEQSCIFTVNINCFETGYRF